MSLEILKKFHKQVEKLKQHQDFFSSVGFSFKAKENEKIKIGGKKIEENTIKVFLVDFRPFFLNKSNFNFGKVCNAVFKNTNNEKVKDNIKKAREVWNKLLETKAGDKSFNGISMKINEQVLSSGKNLDWWINEGYFHPDEEKELKQVKSNPVFEGISKMNFIDLLQRMSQIIFWFDKEVIAQTLKDKQL